MSEIKLRNAIEMTSDWVYSKDIHEFMEQVEIKANQVMLFYQSLFNCVGIYVQLEIIDNDDWGEQEVVQVYKFSLTFYRNLNEGIEYSITDKNDQKLQELLKEWL